MVTKSGGASGETEMNPVSQLPDVVDCQVLVILDAHESKKTFLRGYLYLIGNKNKQASHLLQEASPLWG